MRRNDGVKHWGGRIYRVCGIKKTAILAEMVCLLGMDKKKREETICEMI